MFAFFDVLKLHFFLCIGLFSTSSCLENLFRSRPRSPAAKQRPCTHGDSLQSTSILKIDSPNQMEKIFVEQQENEHDRAE
jgi:hypothetical protein